MLFAVLFAAVSARRNHHRRSVVNDEDQDQDFTLIHRIHQEHGRKNPSTVPKEKEHELYEYLSKEAIAQADKSMRKGERSRMKQLMDYAVMSRVTGDRSRDGKNKMGNRLSPEMMVLLDRKHSRRSRH